jgi:hypothetical protein
MMRCVIEWVVPDVSKYHNIIFKGEAVKGDLTDLASWTLKMKILRYFETLESPHLRTERHMGEDPIRQLTYFYSRNEVKIRPNTAKFHLL